MNVFVVRGIQDRSQLAPQQLQVVLDIGRFHGQGGLIAGRGQSGGFREPLQQRECFDRLLHPHIQILPRQGQVGPDLLAPDLLGEHHLVLLLRGGLAAGGQEPVRRRP